jgi:hypothetical protein
MDEIEIEESQPAGKFFSQIRHIAILLRTVFEVETIMIVAFFSPPRIP